jgi:hypothetical protein
MADDRDRELTDHVVDAFLELTRRKPDDPARRARIRRLFTEKLLKEFRIPDEIAAAEVELTRLGEEVERLRCEQDLLRATLDTLKGEREQRHQEAMDRWARHYDALNGRPETEEDR